jgi:hypothetical protein
MSYQPPNDTDGEKPRFEPEIIPPGADDPWRTSPQHQGLFGQQFKRGVFIARIGPLGFILIGIVILFVAAALLLLFAGALLLWLPAVAFIGLATLVGGALRRYLRRK